MNELTINKKSYNILLKNNVTPAEMTTVITSFLGYDKMDNTAKMDMHNVYFNGVRFFDIYADKAKAKVKVDMNALFFDCLKKTVNSASIGEVNGYNTVSDSKGTTVAITGKPTFPAWYSFARIFSKNFYRAEYDKYQRDMTIYNTLKENNDKKHIDLPPFQLKVIKKNPIAEKSNDKEKKPELNLQLQKEKEKKEQSPKDNNEKTANKTKKQNEKENFGFVVVENKKDITGEKDKKKTNKNLSNPETNPKKPKQIPLLLNDKQINNQKRNLQKVNAKKIIDNKGKTDYRKLNYKMPKPAPVHKLTRKEREIAFAQYQASLYLMYQTKYKAPVVEKPILPNLLIANQYLGRESEMAQESMLLYTGLPIDLHNAETITLASCNVAELREVEKIIQGKPEFDFLQKAIDYKIDKLQDTTPVEQSGKSIPANIYFVTRHLQDTKMLSGIKAVLKAKRSITYSLSNDEESIKADNSTNKTVKDRFDIKNEVEDYKNNLPKGRDYKLTISTSPDKKSILLNIPPCEVQNTNNGCWSCSMGVLLRHAGVNLTQEQIRAYRTDYTPDQTNDGLSCYQSLKERLQLANRVSTDDVNQIEDYVDLIHETTENMAVNYVSFQNQSDKLLSIASNVLIQKHTPISLLYMGHYRTIVGIEGSKLILQDSMVGKEPGYNHQYSNPNDANRFPNHSVIDVTYFKGKEVNLTWLEKITEPEPQKYINNDLRDYDKSSPRYTQKRGFMFTKFDMDGSGVQYDVYLPKKYVEKNLNKEKENIPMEIDIEKKIDNNIINEEEKTNEIKAKDVTKEFLNPENNIVNNPNEEENITSDNNKAKDVTKDFLAQLDNDVNEKNDDNNFSLFTEENQQEEPEMQINSKK